MSVLELGQTAVTKFLEKICLGGSIPFFFIICLACVSQLVSFGDMELIDGPQAVSAVSDLLKVMSVDQTRWWLLLIGWSKIFVHSTLIGRMDSWTQLFWLVEVCMCLFCNRWLCIVLNVSARLKWQSFNIWENGGQFLQLGFISIYIKISVQMFVCCYVEG